MVREKPTFDRRQELENDARRRQAAIALKRAVAELGKDERLGQPLRTRNEIVFPILRVRPAVAIQKVKAFDRDESPLPSSYGWHGGL